MDIPQECSLLLDEETRWKTLDTEWDARQTPDNRRHSDALLSISEDSFANDEDAYESSIESGWEEAKKSRKVRPADCDYHCLLCVDVKQPKPTEADRSTHVLFDSERNGSSDNHHHRKGIKSPLACLKSVAKHPSDVSPSVTDHHAFNRAVNYALCGDDAFLEAGQFTLVEAFPESVDVHRLGSQCAKMTGEDRNVPAIVSSFNVLPPVRAQEAYDQQGPALRRPETAENRSAGCGASDRLGLHGVFATGEKICELIRVGMDSDVPQARCGPFPSGHQRSSGSPCQSQPGKHLQITLARKRDSPLNVVGEFFPRTGYRLVRNVKCKDLSKVSVRNHNGNRLYFELKSRSVATTALQLPALLGTRVPLPVTSHRLL